MATHSTNVGRVDALARRIVGGLAVLGGLVSLNGFFWSMPFLTWVVLAAMMATGLFFLLGGLRGGTGLFGLLLMALTVLDGWLALRHQGQWALIAGLIVGADGFLTASRGWSVVNALLHKDTHDADPEWSLTTAAAH